MGKRRAMSGRRSLSGSKRFSRSQVLAISGLLLATAIAVIAVSRASIPIYRDNWDFWGARIKSCESSGNYRALNPSSTASGAWQILDGTWAGFGGYPRAYLAPPEVQDAKALQLFRTRGTEPWDASYGCWQLGRSPAPVTNRAAPLVPANAAPVGAVEKAACTLSGWAFDPSNPDASISIEVRLDGQSAAVITAADPRPDINQVRKIGGNHGFGWAVPGKWRDRAPHSYQVLGIDAQDGNQRPQLAAGSLTCEPAGVGDGFGLTGQYFANDALAGRPKVTRVDPNVNFDWGFGSPDSGLPLDHFSVRWSGRLLAQYSELYTFTARADDGVRVYVGDKLIVNDWNDHVAKESGGSIQLEAGKSYDIRVEYYEARWRSSIRLSWSSYSTPFQPVPARQLYPAGQ
jgi:hypothetical protein